MSIEVSIASIDRHSIAGVNSTDDPENLGSTVHEFNVLNVNFVLIAADE